jgi:hypothetical protein
MNYKVVPFVAKLSQSDTTKAVADQLDLLINDMSSQGWEYVRLENVDTVIKGAPGQNGCFGLGATPAEPDYTTSYMVAVFKKS